MSKSCCDDKKHTTGGGVDKLLLAIVGFTILSILGVVYFGMKLGQTAAVKSDENATITLAETSYDWGEIGINDGIVTQSFSLTNSGSSPLKLFDVKTSCMCTTAKIITPQGTSREYGMHETSSEVMQLQPGEEGQVEVAFDPAYHGPSGTGAISRIVSMKTNDAQNPEVNFRLTAMVTN